MLVSATALAAQGVVICELPLKFCAPILKKITHWCARFLVLAFSCTDNAESAASLSFAIGKSHPGNV